MNVEHVPSNPSLACTHSVLRLLAAPLPVLSSTHAAGTLQTSFTNFPFSLDEWRPKRAWSEASTVPGVVFR